MNSYERIMTAFRHQEPDTVPITEFGVNEKIWRALGCNSLYEWQQKAGYDMIVVRITYRKSNADGVYYDDEWGVRFKRNDEATGHSFGHPIGGPEDMGKLILPDPDDPYHFNYLEKAVKDFKSERAICFSTRACFLWAVELCGMDNLLMLMATEPDFVDELLEKIVQNQIRLVTNAIQAGAEVIDDTDDFASNIGPIISPAMFEKFIVPKLTRFANAVHAAGGKLIKHTDGNVMKLLDMIVGCGADAFHSVDPSAGMVIGDVKRLYGDKLTLFGNIDCGNLLMYGNREDVRMAVLSCMRHAAPGGGFVLASSNTIPSSAKPDNVQAMIDYTRQYGDYKNKNRWSEI